MKPCNKCIHYYYTNKFKSYWIIYDKFHVCLRDRGGMDVVTGKFKVDPLLDGIPCKLERSWLGNCGSKGKYYAEFIGG